MGFSKEQVEQKIKEIVAGHFGEPTKSITGQTSFVSLNADELDFVEVLMDVEYEFEILIADEDESKILTVDDLVEVTFKTINQSKEI